MPVEKPLRFHWRLPHGGERFGETRSVHDGACRTGLPDLRSQVEFCRAAEECGIDSLLTDFGAAKPDPMLLSAALGLATRTIKFIIAYRSGLLSPTSFVQQVNTLSALIDGRLSVNIVAGNSPEEQKSYGDFLSHDERYDRTGEFLSICSEIWRNPIGVSFAGKYYKVEKAKLNTPFVSPDRESPEIFIGGGSAQAEQLALDQGTCWLRLANTAENIYNSSRAVISKGKEVALRLSVISRPTRNEAVRAAYSLLERLDSLDGSRQMEGRFVMNSDSTSIRSTLDLTTSEWPAPNLWTGAVPFYGSTAIALVGTPEEVAGALMEYRDAGVSQFILSGWPKLESMRYFSREVLPLVRKKERIGRKILSPACV
jgi:alkanesulfonate monooxygenase